MVDTCTPEPLAAIVPATPEERTCVVETGRFSSMKINSVGSPGRSEWIAAGGFGLPNGVGGSTERPGGWPAGSLQAIGGGSLSWWPGMKN